MDDNDTSPYVVARKKWEEIHNRRMSADESREFGRAWSAFCSERRATAAARGTLVVSEVSAVDARAFGTRWKPDAELPGEEA